MNYTEYCKELCVKNLNADDVNNFVWMINRNYKVNWYYDKNIIFHSLFLTKTH